MHSRRDVFISHASEDKAIADAACARLEAAAIKCWIAPRDAIAGVPYARQLIDAISQARIFLLVVSEFGNKSEHVLREVEIAAHSGAIIVPMRVQDVLPDGDLRYYIEYVHWFDAVAPPIDERLDELARLITELLGHAGEESAGSASKESPSAALASAPRTNLPARLASFVGRERDVAAIADLIATSRLVTLNGAGGVGKTRCAVEVGRAQLNRFKDGVWFIDLSAIRENAEVAAAVASVTNCPALPSGNALDAILAYLKNQRSLLIFDNCEHVIEEVRKVVVALEKSCEHVVILATSREALNLYGERLYRMPALDGPDAVALFVDRAAASDARFALTEENAPYVTEICRRLDGIPLAIELAAAHVKMLTPGQLARRLHDALEFLSGPDRLALPRQQTLRALFDWSHDLLSERERVLFRRLAIFVGTFALEIAASVSADERISEEDVFAVIESLADKSLLQAEIVGEESRYRLLETVREYASEKLEASGEKAALRASHARAYAELAEASYQDRPSLPDAIWLPRAASDFANLRAVLTWALKERGDELIGQRVAGAMRSIWSRLAVNEGREWLCEALDSVNGDTPAEVIARLELAKAELDLMYADYTAALPAARHALQIFSELRDAGRSAEAQLFAGAASGMLGDSVNGKALLEAALDTFRTRRADRQIGSALRYLALVHLREGDIEGARGFFADALQILRVTPGGERAARHLAAALAELEFQSGNILHAIDLAGEALAKDRALKDDVLVVFDLCNVSAYFVALGHFDESIVAAREAFELACQYHIEICKLFALQHFAAIAALRLPQNGNDGAVDARIAAQLIGFVDAQVSSAGTQREYTEQQEYEKLWERLQSALGNERFEMLRLQGSKRSESEAAALIQDIVGGTP